MKYETIPQTVEAWQAQADMELIDDTQPIATAAQPPQVVSLTINVLGFTVALQWSNP